MEWRNNCLFHGFRKQKLSDTEMMFTLGLFVVEKYRDYYGNAPIKLRVENRYG